MLNILFVILKILAIIIASILGLLLFLLLVILFVPIRYRADVRKNDEIVIKARVNWLLRIVFARIWFINQQLHLRLRVFGICIYDNLRPKKEKKVKKSSPNLKKSRVKKKRKKDREKTQDLLTQVKESRTQVEESNTQIVETKVLKVTDPRSELNVKIEVTPEEAQEKLEESKIDHTLQQGTIPSESNGRKESIDHKQISQEGKVYRIFSKIKAFFGKIKTILLKFFGLGAKMKRLLYNMKAKLKHLRNIIKGLWDKKNKITTFLKDEINKAGIKLALRQVFMVLKHCAPKKISGYIRYGTGDPCSTGESFAIAALFYGKYGNSLKLVPDFDDEVLEAEVMVRGRIRIFSLLIIGIKLIRDKNFSKLLKNAKQLKEEL